MLQLLCFICCLPPCCQICRSIHTLCSAFAYYVLMLGRGLRLGDLVWCLILCLVKVIPYCINLFFHGILFSWMCIREVSGKLSCWYFCFGSFLCLTFAFLSMENGAVSRCLDIINLLLLSYPIPFHSWHANMGRFSTPTCEKAFSWPGYTERLFYFWGFHLFSVWEKRCLALFLWLACWFTAHGFACLVLIACFASFFSFTWLLMNCFNVFLFLSPGV